MKIAYWSTSCLEPQHEAVSQEVFRLSAAFPGSWIFGVSKHYFARFSWRGRYAGAHACSEPVLRAIIPLIERRFDVSHVYGDMTPWLFHKALHARPLIHTVTQDSPEPVVEFLERCTAVVVQTEATRDRVLALGLDPTRVHLERPGIDLERFKPESRKPPSEGASRIFFASAPRTAREMEERGVHLLLEAARRSSWLPIHLLYRPWGSGYTSLEATRRIIEEQSLRNVHLSNEVVTDMPRVYAGSDFTIVPFTTRDGGKECPNSAVESLACGVPVLVTKTCPFARFVEENACGVTFDPNPQGLAEAVRRGIAVWPELSTAARRAAESHFDSRKLLSFYGRVYREASEGARQHAIHA